MVRLLNVGSVYTVLAMGIYRLGEPSVPGVERTEGLGVEG